MDAVLSEGKTGRSVLLLLSSSDREQMLQSTSVGHSIIYANRPLGSAAVTAPTSITQGNCSALSITCSIYIPISTRGGEKKRFQYFLNITLLISIAFKIMF